MELSKLSWSKFIQLDVLNGSKFINISLDLRVTTIYVIYLIWKSKTAIDFNLSNFNFKPTLSKDILICKIVENCYGKNKQTFIMNRFGHH